MQIADWRRAQERRARLERQGEHAARQAEERRRRERAAQESRRFEEQKKERARAQAEEAARQRAAEVAAAALARARACADEPGGPPSPTPVPVWLIQKVVAEHFEVAMADLSSARRQQAIVWPRQIAMYLAKQLTPRSYPDIGNRFGGRDHTTALHGVRKVEWALGRVDSELLSARIAALKEIILERAEALARHLKP